MASKSPQYVGGSAQLDDIKSGTYVAKPAIKASYCSRTTTIVAIVVVLVLVIGGGMGAAVYFTGVAGSGADDDIGNSTSLAPSAAPSIDLDLTKSPTGTKSPTTPTVATDGPTKSPSAVVTKSPTVTTNSPTRTPTIATKSPTIATKSPTKTPTIATKSPTIATKSPTKTPTIATKSPTAATKSPTKTPTAATKSPTASGTSPTRFDIQLIFLSSLTAEETAAFTTAKARWEEVITGDLGSQAVIPAGLDICDQISATDILIDDIVIFVSIGPIDGVNGILGQAGPCGVLDNYVRAGVMIFDSADTANMAALGMLGSVILHEMGHVLGIGTMWDSFGLISPVEVTSNIKYLGTNGNAGHVAIGGTGQADIEDTGGDGTARGHWKETVYENELMTGFLSGTTQPMSLMTIRSLQDLGYVVDTTKADAYVKPGSSGRRLREPAIRMGADLYTGPVVQLTEWYPKPGREQEEEDTQPDQ